MVSIDFGIDQMGISKMKNSRNPGFEKQENLDLTTFG
jgi:hypothetical protein